MEYTRYIAEIDKDENIEDLFRIRKNAHSIWYELFDGENWVDSKSLISIINNLHNPYYKEVSEDNAEKYLKEETKV